MGTKIDVAKIAEPYREDIRSKVKKLKEAGIGEALFIFYTSTCSSSMAYTEFSR